MLRDKLYSLVLYTCALLILYILALTIFVKSPMQFDLPAYLIMLFAFFILFAVTLIRYKSRNMNVRTKYFKLLLIAITIGIRLAWVLSVQTVPVSDFHLYNDYAFKASQGTFRVYDPSYSVFPFKFGYPLMLSFIYRIFGPHLFVLKLFNVFISACTTLQIYYISKRIFSEEVGLFSGLLFCLWPAQIMFNSVLASEHFFLLFLLLSVQFFIMFTENLRHGKKYFYLSGVGISLALMQFIRPLVLVVIPVLVFYLLIFIRIEGSKKKAVIEKLTIALTICGMFSLSFLLLTIPFSKLIGVNIYKSSSGFSFLVGTNFISGGSYNTQDEKIIQEFNYDFNRIHKEAASRAVNRILSHPAQFAMLTEKKVIAQWASEDYGVLWSMQNAKTGNSLGNYFKKNPIILEVVSQLYYIFILIFAIAGCLLCIRNRKDFIIIFILVFQGLFFVHTFFEVQTRYHFPAVPGFIILAGYGLSRKMKAFKVLSSS